MTTEEDTLYVYAGQLSMCWEHIDQAGVFQSEDALAITNRMKQHIHERVERVLTKQSGLSVEHVNKLVCEIMERL